MSRRPHGSNGLESTVPYPLILACQYLYLHSTWVELKSADQCRGLIQKTFLKIRVISWLRMHLSTCSKVFYKPLKTLGIDMWIPIPIQRYKNTSGKDTDLIVEKIMNNGKAILMVLLCSIQSFHLKILIFSIQSFLYCSLVF